MPAAYPKEFRDDVVVVARWGDMRVKRIAKDFGITESCLCNRIARDGVEVGARPDVTEGGNEDLEKARHRPVEGQRNAQTSREKAAA